MANTKISEMEEATSISENDILPIVKDGSNKKASIKTVFKTVQGFLVPDSIPIGMVVEFPSDNIPDNWLLCNVQAVSRTDYAELFAAIGTTWGAGDGNTTFNVPTKEGLVTVGKKANDSDFNALGKTGGEKTHTLTVAEMAAHAHGENIVSQYGYQYSLVGENGEGTQKVGYLPTLSGSEVSKKQLLTDDSGGGQPHNNLQPYTVSNFIIKAKQSSGVVATVVDNLNSTSATDALSAKQGKILNDKIADTGWVNLTLSNGWKNLGEQYPPAQYRKIGKQVFLRGLIQNNSSNTTMLLNLDSSIKPLKTNYIIVTESDAVKSACVETSGTVNMPSYTKGNWVNLGNISYFID